jgi:hypothetical protein
MADTSEHSHETGGAWNVTRWAVPGCPACAPESPRADVELTEALHRAFHEHWAPDKSLDLYPDSPLWQAQAVAVERILADRLAAVQAEARESGRLQGREEIARLWDQDNAHERLRAAVAPLVARAESAEAERDGAGLDTKS